MPTEICPSSAAIDLIGNLLVEKESRLSTRRYALNDWARKTYGLKKGPFDTDKDSRTYAGYFVYPGDGEDIKNHPWFTGVPWDTLHLQRPPFLPRVKTWEDTKYFDEEEIVSDIDSNDSDEDLLERLTGFTENHTPKLTQPSKASRSSHHQPETQHIVPSAALELEENCISGPRSANDRSGVAVQIHLPPNLLSTQPQIDGAVSQIADGGVYWNKEIIEEATSKPLMPRKKKEQKRPRDKILRDQDCAAIALRMRKNGAFLGYGYRRAKAISEVIEQVVHEQKDSAIQVQQYDPIDHANSIELEVEHVEDLGLVV